uniref:Stum, mechanosensory transduction mediator homolog n=1 Tax=Buteo japonicus TaxID=224669 RepID=A0A8C0B706_9AVES
SEFFVSWSQAEPRAATPVGLREGIWHEAVAFTGCFVAALSLGTFVSAFTVLCGARTDLPDRHMCCVFWLNIAAALIQILTAIVMVGWIMSIFWGMDMVILASKASCPQESPGDYPGPSPSSPGYIYPKAFFMFHTKFLGCAGLFSYS